LIARLLPSDLLYSNNRRFTDMNPPNQPVAKFVDDPTVRPIFINKVVVVHMDIGGTIFLTLGDTRHVPTQAVPSGMGTQMPDVYVSTRLALTPMAAAEVVHALQPALQHLKALAAGRGLDPSMPTPSTPTN
jgi:hypothetical protein